jgi:DNA-binding XRE family transcriptional regulator
MMGEHAGQQRSKTDMRRGVAVPYLGAWRAYRLMSQAELARRAHISRETVRAAEAGQPIRLVNVVRLARALGTDRERLVREQP